MTCSYAELDGSYVLGALSPTERREFERHLDTCLDCARSVRELAGLPGLLGRVDPVILESAPLHEPVPDTLLPALVREVGRARRRRLFATVGVAVAAAVAAVAVMLVPGMGGHDTPSAVPPAARPTTSAGQWMQPVGHVPVTATVAFTPVAWGTRLDLTCSYEHPAGDYRAPSAVTYRLFVVNRDGRSEQVGTWRALDGETMRITAGTAAQRRDIAGVEVRTSNGRPVLQLRS